MKLDSINFKLEEIIDAFLKSTTIFVPTAGTDVEKFHSAILRGYFAGGCFTSMLLREEPSDYDFYFRNEEDANIFKEFALKHLKADIAFESPNAITMKNKMQFMTKHYGPPNYMVNSFDFQHLKVYKVIGVPIIVATKDFYQILVEKHLIYSGSEYPLASLMRIRKYIKRGWFISANTMLDIVFDIMSMFILKNADSDNIHVKHDKHEIRKNRRHMKIDVDILIEQMMGIDPLTIMAELSAHTGMRFSLNEIIDIISGHKKS